MSMKEVRSGNTRHPLYPLFLGIFGIICIIAGVVFAAEFNTLPSARAEDQSGTNATPALNVPMTALGDNPFREVIKQIRPAVVNIETERRAGSMGAGMEDAPFPFFGPPPSEPNPFGDTPEEDLYQTGGSGFIVDPDGYIITNNHVIQDAVNIRVTMDDGRSYDAELVGTDPSTDVAVIKMLGLKGKLASSLRLADSEKVEIGDWVIAVGSPLGLTQTVTVGVLSAKNRQEVNIQGSKYSDFLQTDAAINFGNSGGPLLTIDGRVVGMNTAIAGGPNVSGIGFAVPANKIKFVYENLRTHGKVLRGYIGIYVGPVSSGLAKSNQMESAYGALVTKVDPDTPAGRAGLKFGDIVVGVDGVRVMNRQHLVNMVAEKGVGKVVTLQILRDHGQTELTVKTEQRPDEADEIKPASTNEDSSGGTTKSEVLGDVGLKVGELTPELKSRLGLDASEHGVLVEAVKKNSDAHREGIDEGDLISAVNSKSVDTVADFRAALQGAAGDYAQLTVKRQIQGEWVSFLFAIEVPATE